MPNAQITTGENQDGGSEERSGLIGTIRGSNMGGGSYFQVQETIRK